MSPTREPGGLDDEERAVVLPTAPEKTVLAEAFTRYARHLDGCTQAPCSCGLAALLPGGQDPI